MAFVCVESSAAGMPRDDVVEDFLQQFFQRFQNRAGPGVHESTEAFTLTLELPPGCVATPEVYAISDTFPHGEPIVVLVIRAGALEWWALVPVAVQIDGVQADVEGGVVRVTLPKRPRERR
jgi:hypothetical protein